MNDQAAVIRHAADTASGAAIVASLMGWLSPVAALLGALWYVLQIYGWIEKRVTRAKSLKHRNIA